MLPTGCFSLLLGLSVSPVWTQATTSQVLAVVAFVTAGETTTRSDDNSMFLTPKGAQQLFRQGTAFRARYLSNTTTNTSTEVTPIRAFSLDIIDNSQLSVVTGTSEGLVSGAAAFMQGLYPPRRSNSSGGQDAGAIDYPLGGYQYANIRTYGPADSESSAIQGDQGCSVWLDEMQENFAKSPGIVSKVSETQDFYSGLATSGPLQGQASLADANYLEAVKVFQDVKYLYDNNRTVHDGLAGAGNTLNMLESNAFSLELAKTRYNKTDNKELLSVLYGIAGRTLASYVTASFSDFMLGNGRSGKFTVMFGSWRPVMSFFSSASLFDLQDLTAPFSQLPKPGSAIIFELIDVVGSGDTGGLQVQFYYRPSADLDDTFTSYPLFGSGFGGTVMSYSAFSRRMKEIGRTASEWCSICKPADTTSFCHQFAVGGGSSGSKDSSKHMSRPVAGILGGTIVLVVIAGIAAVLAVLGWTCTRKAKPNGTCTFSRWFGGNKKPPGDADVTISSAGRKEERIGSWELGARRREGQKGALDIGVVTSDFADRTKRMDDDSVSISGVPVNTRDGV